MTNPQSISITYMVTDTGTYDDRGRRLARVVERYEGVDVPDREFVLPGAASGAFVRARREIAKRELEAHGYTKQDQVDWSFLRDNKEPKQ